MSRALVLIHHKEDRERAQRWLRSAPYGTRVQFMQPKRTLPQNHRMWAMLTDIASQKEHAGRRYTADQWKILFMHACGREVQFLPALDNATFVPFGQSSSELSVHEMADLITFMQAWGAENGVVFHDQKENA